MRTMLHSSFFWQMSCGFVLGVAGMVALQPADATRTLVSHFIPAAHVSR